MVKKIIISILCITSVLLSSCGEGSSGSNQSSAASSVEMHESSSVADSSSSANNNNRIEYDNQVIYESSNLRISLKAIHLEGDVNDPNAIVEIELLTESLGDDHIHYDSHFLYINDFKLYSNIRMLISLDGHTKEIKTIRVSKEEFDTAGIKQIEKIKLDDSYVKIGYSNRDNEKLSNAEVKLSSPYELKWE